MPSEYSPPNDNENKGGRIGSSLMITGYTFIAVTIVLTIYVAFRKQSANSQNSVQMQPLDTAKSARKGRADEEDGTGLLWKDSLKV